MAWAAQEKIHQINLAYRGPSIVDDILGSDEDGLADDITYEERQACELLLSKKRRKKENTQSESSERLQEPFEKIDEWLNQHGSFLNALSPTDFTYLLKQLTEKSEPSQWEYFTDYSSRIPIITQYWENIFSQENTILHDYDDKRIITVDEIKNEYPYVFFKVHSHEGKRHIYFTKDRNKVQEIRDLSFRNDKSTDP